MDKKATWFLPALINGSGGHRTILQHANHMQNNGYDVEICLENFSGFRGSAGKAVESLFGYSFSSVKVGWENYSSSDLYFATVWYSAKFVRDIPEDKSKYYFVQDYEALFNPVGDAYVEAENSYTYDLFPITIGRWLTKSLYDYYEVQGGCFDFGADRSIYAPVTRSDTFKQNRKSICFIYQPEKPRRCSDLGIRALKVVKERYPNLDIYLYGSSQEYRENGFINLGLVPLEKCAELYRSCDVGLCISASNPSRIPFEMMACGLPVVEIHRENNLYDLPEDAVLLAKPSQESIASAIISILEDEELAQSMSDSGVVYMNERSLENEVDQFLAIVNAYEEGSFVYHEIKKINTVVPVRDTNYVSIDHHYGAIEVAQTRRIQVKNIARQILPPLVWTGLKRLKGGIK